MSEPLHKKYRPKRFADVVGQPSTVKPLQRLIKEGKQQAFLFSSNIPGVGKTTLARIAAKAAGCMEKDIREIPAAVYTGVDDMRLVQSPLQYEPFGGSKGRAVILDECHRLSKQAWDSLLKIIEEPPPYVFWFFCTTEVDKVPKTIRSRCQCFNLGAVPDTVLEDLCQTVCNDEGMDLPEDVVSVIIKEAAGSPRQMLINLEACRESKTKKEAAALLHSALASDATRELCQFLMRNDGRSWQKAMTIIGKMDGESAEGVRIVVCNYIGAVLKSAKTERETLFALRILEAFSTPYNLSEKYSPLMLSVGRVLYGD